MKYYLIGLNSMFDELKEVKYFKEVTDSYRVLLCKIL